MRRFRYGLMSALVFWVIMISFVIQPDASHTTGTWLFFGLLTVLDAIAWADEWVNQIIQKIHQ